MSFCQFTGYVLFILFLHMCGLSEFFGDVYYRVMLVYV